MSQGEGHSLAMPISVHGRYGMGLLLIVSGAFGAGLGYINACWQHPIETAQVLMGLVQYDHFALPYVYHVSLFSLLNYLAWLCLAMTGSEVTTSYIIAALLGMLSLQVIALAVFLIKRHVVWALALTALIVGVVGVGKGIAYPILFLNSEHTYGRAGLVLPIMAVLLLGFSRYRTGIFLAALAMGVHPTWGAWMIGCIGLALLSNFRRYRFFFNRGNVLAFLAGLLIPTVLLVWQRSHFHAVFQEGLADRDAAVAAEAIYWNYISFWDHHRQRFSEWNILQHGLSRSILTFYLARVLLEVAEKKRNLGQALFFRIVAVSSALSWIFVFVPSWFDAHLFPKLLVTLMPGRFINFSIFLCSPLLMAALCLPKEDITLRRRLILAGAVFLLFAGQFAWQKIIFICLLLYVLYRVIAACSHPDICALRDRLTTLPSTTLFALLLGIALAYHAVVREVRGAPVNPFTRISVPAEIKGTILTTMDRYMLQVETRHGALMPHLDGYLYSNDPSALLALNEFTRDIYGISLTVAPPPGLHLHGSTFSTADFQKLWETRSCSEWQALAEKFKFDMVLVPNSLVLQLPRLDSDPVWNKYRPVCGENASVM